MINIFNQPMVILLIDGRSQDVFPIIFHQIQRPILLKATSPSRTAVSKKKVLRPPRPPHKLQ